MASKANPGRGTTENRPGSARGRERNDPSAWDDLVEPLADMVIAIAMERREAERKNPGMERRTA